MLVWLCSPLERAHAALAVRHLITGIAAIGMLVALSGLRRRPAQQVELPGNLGTGNLGTGNLGTGNLRVGELTADGVAGGLVSGERGDGQGVADRGRP